MKDISILMRMLTDSIKPGVGMRHALTVTDGFEDVAEMDNVNIVITLMRDSGHLLIFLTDEDLELPVLELFDVIEKMVQNYDSRL